MILNLAHDVEQELQHLAALKHATIERIVTDALKLYAEQLDELHCLSIIDARSSESSISHDEVLQRLKSDGLL